PGAARCRPGPGVRRHMHDELLQHLPGPASEPAKWLDALRDRFRSARAATGMGDAGALGSDDGSQRPVGRRVPERNDPLWDLLLLRRRRLVHPALTRPGAPSDKLSDRPTT